MAQKKIQISFPPAVALEMDEYCKQTDLSRSGLVTLAVTSYLEGRRVTSALNRLCDVLEKIPSGELSEKDLHELEEMQTTMRALTARTK